MVGLNDTSNESYSLGQLTGEIIEHKYLPTMETDMLKTFNVIKVDDTDIAENKRLDGILDNTYRMAKGPVHSKIAHTKWIEHTYTLADKYLPSEITCLITKIEPKDINAFKEGLISYLWNTDLSWYMPEDDFFKPNNPHAWCSTIVLTRTRR